MEIEKCEARCVEPHVSSWCEGEGRVASEQNWIQNKGNESGDVDEK